VLANGYNNLGINLILIGPVGQSTGSSGTRFGAGVRSRRREMKKWPMILDSLGELLMLRGELDEAKDYLGRAVALATDDGNKWYACQALRTLAVVISPWKIMQDVRKGNEALSLAENIGDRKPCLNPA